MTCNEFIDFLIDYYEDNLPDDRRQMFDKHMSACPDCVSYLDSYKETVELVKEAAADPESEWDDDVPPGLVEAILASKPE